MISSAGRATTTRNTRKSHSGARSSHRIRTKNGSPPLPARADLLSPLNACPRSPCKGHDALRETTCCITSIGCGASNASLRGDSGPGFAEEALGFLLRKAGEPDGFVKGCGAVGALHQGSECPRGRGGEARNAGGSPPFSRASTSLVGIADHRLGGGIMSPESRNPVRHAAGCRAVPTGVRRLRHKICGGAGILDQQ